MMLDAILSGVRLFEFGPGQSSGRSARLHKALVERKLATEASSEFWPAIDPSVFALDVTVWEGVSIDRAERALMEEKSVDLGGRSIIRSEEHTSELQSHLNLVCRLLLEKKKK